MWFLLHCMRYSQKEYQRTVFPCILQRVLLRPLFQFDGGAMSDQRRDLPLTSDKSALDELQSAVFKFLIERVIPLVPNVEQPAILIELIGRRLIVSQIESHPSERDNISEYKRMLGSSLYIYEQDSRKV